MIFYIWDNIDIKKKCINTIIMNCFYEKLATDINAARKNHFMELNLDLKNKTVLEVGCGPTGYFTDMLLSKGCIITCQDAREEIIKLKKEKDQNMKLFTSNLNVDDSIKEHYDFIFSYGLLYHLSSPENGIKIMAQHADNIIMSTIVLPGDEPYMVQRNEVNQANQAFDGIGNRATRSWIYNNLKKYYKHVYISKKQAKHPEFPINWNNLIPTSTVNLRCCFFATNNENIIDKSQWSEEILNIQEY
tara:strand:+ start:400 stop:1137 length:738 start_codon:yes stop_codon:yes gene_type:complete